MKELHSIKTGKGRRTYYFDIKESEREEYYMKITMEEFDHGETKRNTIMVFEEDMEEFKKGLKEMFGFLNFKRKG